MAIMEIYDKIRTSSEKNELAVGLFINFSKAFDTWDHNKLLNKLELYGIRGVALAWFKSYLSHRA